MSTHAYSLPDPERAGAVVAACAEAGRPAYAMSLNGGQLVLEFRPDLTAGEAATLDEIVAAYRTILTLGEYRAIRDDVAALKAYLGLGSPTLAQTAAATRAIIRVLSVIIRD